MKVVLIGSGNVATVFGKLIINGGHSVTEVVSRNRQHAQELAETLGANASTDFYKISKEADLYIIAVADNAIAPICAELKLDNKTIVHTSGAVSKEALKIASENYGVLYPLQSLRKEKNTFPVIPLLVDGSNPETIDAIQTIAISLSSKVFVAGDEQRLKLHIAAVIASNFSNYLYALAEDYCEQENIPFHMLIPLIQETAFRLNEFSAKDVQTGPAARGDNDTIQKHLALLSGHPSAKRIYECISAEISSYYSGKQQPKKIPTGKPGRELL